MRFATFHHFISILLPFAAVADELPSTVVPVPVTQARCLAVHPSKPVLYVGLSAGTDGKGLASFNLDEKGVPIAGSRKDIVDGVAGSTNVPSGSEYSIGNIAVNPVLPQIYLSPLPRRISGFRANTNTADVVAVALDETGLPIEKIASLRSPRRVSPVHHLACDASGRYVYLGEVNGSLGVWPVGEEEIEPTIKTQAAPKHNRPPVKPKTAKAGAFKNLITPPMRITDWIYVPEWRRCYGSDASTLKVCFSFSEDGLSCAFAQPIATQSRFQFPTLVSVKHQKMYVPNAQGSKLGVYLLAREGRLTSVPRFASVDPVRLACLDDKNDLLYVITPKWSLSIYPLDSEGDLKGEPRRFDLNLGVVNDAVLSPKTSVLYLACSSPPGGKP